MESITPPAQAPADSPHLCECGCGQPTTPSKQTYSRSGYKKGQPNRFLPNHQTRKDNTALFWSRIDKSGGPDACWPWMHRRERGGYGVTRWHGKTWKAHRLAWELTNGPIPKDVVIRHKVCDNPPCCNPAHLLPGTLADNIGDMVAKGRQRALRGEQHPTAKLTQLIANAIREQHARNPIPYTHLAKQYGVSDSLIAMVIKGEVW